jgi:hypothetical protein
MIKRGFGSGFAIFQSHSLYYCILSYPILYYLIPYYDLYMLMYSLASCTPDLSPADWRRSMVPVSAIYSRDDVLESSDMIHEFVALHMEQYISLSMY